MKKRFDLSRAAFLFSSAILVFAYGIGVGRYEIFPFSVLQFGIDALREAGEDAPALLRLRPPDPFLQPARYEGEGVLTLRESRAFPGLTFVSGFFGNDNELRLVRLDGTVIRRWPVQFSDIFTDLDYLESTGRAPTGDWFTDIHGALALPDGSVVLSFEYLGMVKLDRCGEVLWTVPRMTHHSIEPSRDGGFWVPGRLLKEAIPGFPEDGGPYEEDQILKISGEGTVLEEVPVTDLFFANDIGSLLLVRVTSSGFADDEVAHLNDIEELPDSISNRFPQFAAGDLLLSFRNLNLIMVVDPVSWDVKWHQSGPWIRQHDPDFLPDGTISVFNNNTVGALADTAVFGVSHVMTLDPSTGASSVRYGTGSEQDMHTTIRGKHQTLPNGNVLITQWEAGRLIEVDGAGEIVWEYINRYDEDEVATLTQATRYPADYFAVEDWSCGNGG